MSSVIPKRSRQSTDPKNEIIERLALRFHLFLLLTGQGASQGAESEAVEQPVEAERAQQAVDDTTKSEAAEQTTHDTEHTCEQEADGGDDLEEGLAQEAPEGVELLLGVGHVLELALGALNGLGDGAGELCVVCQ